MVLPLFLLAQFVSLSQAATLISSDCPSDSLASCTTTPPDTCCAEYPGGQLLQAQFWDTDVAGSPADSWTIHGLWNNDCNGTYLEWCDLSPTGYNVTEFLIEQGATSTLDFMSQCWLNDDSTNEELWEHEWDKHGTCFSTLVPSCLPSGSADGADVVAYCETIVSLFQTLPTYNWLADAGITPSSSMTYSLSDLLSALESGSGGYTPYLECSDGALSEIYWYFTLQGSVIDGTFLPMNSPQSSDCPDTDISYPPKSG